MSVERDVLDIDVVFVGAGPASLAGAFHLAKLIEKHNATAQEKIEVEIAVLEKGAEIGSHALSGAVVDPRAFMELFPEDWQSAPFEGTVEKESFLGMTRKRAFSLPIPPPLKNKGKKVASLGKLLRWMAEKVEAAGVDIFCEFPVTQALFEEGRVVGVRTGDRGLDKEGNEKSNYEPGGDIHTQVVVLGEGPRGTVSKQLEERFDLCAGKNPQVYAIGIKEIWELPAGRLDAGEVIHSFGWPLDSQTFGGGFVYGMQDNLAIVGLVVGLDYVDPLLDPHSQFQRFKTHPHFAPMLAGGKMLFYGAKAIPEGGWWAMPRPWGDGFLLCGDSGGFLNGQKLKGVHLGMKSGMLAAETIFAGLLKRDLSAAQLATYQTRVEESWIKKEMYPTRNFHQAFEKGALAGFLQAGLGMISGGRGWGLFDRLGNEPGHQRMVKLTSADARRMRLDQPREEFQPDGELTFDKLANVYNSGAAHEEEQPVHLHVADPELCVTTCAVEYANPCQRFCPANVYEMVDDSSHASGKRLQINASNCVHCKTCDIMDPYQVITWVPPEGGGGPNYGKM